MFNNLLIGIIIIIFIVLGVFICVKFVLFSLIKKHGSEENLIEHVSIKAKDKKWFKNQEFYMENDLVYSCGQKKRTSCGEKLCKNCPDFYKHNKNYRIVCPELKKFLSEIKISKINIVNKIIRKKVKKHLLFSLGVRKDILKVVDN